MLPVLMAAPHRDLAPHAYTILKLTSHCRCGALHESSQVYAKTHIRSQMGHKYVTNLRPVRDPSEIAYNVPIEVQSRPVEQIPFCHECFASVSLAHLPTPPQPTNEQINRKLMDMDIIKHHPKRTRYWKDGTERYEDTEAQETKAKAKKFTVDDL